MRQVTPSARPTERTPLVHFSQCATLHRVGAERAAVMYTLIHTAKLNAVDPQVWLADVLARIADHPVNRVELLPWKWKLHAETAPLSQAA
jgi:IS66 C-terminal element